MYLNKKQNRAITNIITEHDYFVAAVLEVKLAKAGKEIRKN